MTTLDVTSVSAKGQVVIPGRIRTSLGIKSGARLAVLTDGENILMKPLEAPMLAAFEKLVQESRSLARRTGMKRSDVARAIKKARNENRT